MALGSFTERNYGGFFGWLVNVVVRFLQLVLGLAVVGLYGGAVNNARLSGQKPDSNYVFAVVVGSVGAITALILAMPCIKASLVFAWDLIMLILWAAVFGLFGKMYIHTDPNGDSGIQQQKNAVWIDLVNMLLWFVSFLLGLAMFFVLRRKKSLYTARAEM